MRSLASLLLMTQLSLLSLPGLRPHAPDLSASACDRTSAGMEHTARAGLPGDDSVEASRNCQHCGAPECAVMPGCAGISVAIVEESEAGDFPIGLAIRDIVGAHSLTSSIRAPALPPPRA